MSRLAQLAALFLLALAASLPAWAQSDKPAAASPGNACASLTEALEKSGDAMAPVSLAQAREYQRRDDQPACRLALQRIPFGNPPAAVTPAPAPAPANTEPTTAATPQAAPQPPQPPRTLTAAQMRPMAVWNDKERLGDVRRVVVGPDEQRYVIVATGGFLGIGERLVAVRGDSLRNNGDRLIAEMTEPEIRALPEATETAYRDLPDNETITLRP